MPVTWSMGVALSSRVRYEEVQCRSAINRVKGMGFRWSLNPYRGCVHGCHYCFARRFHSYYDLRPGDDFTGVIMVKVNSPRVVAEELSRPSWRREEVALGTATDPYQPIEGKYRLTRGCLEAFAAWRSPVGLVTKGTMVVRDIDVLQELTRRADCTVCFSVTTMDTELTDRLEPGTPPPLKRLAAMERLVRSGVKAGVALAPIIPGITDSVSNLRTVIRSAADHGARFLWGSTLYLQPGTKEHFFGFLEREYPELVTDFQRLYPAAYAPRWTQSDVKQRVATLRRSHGVGGGGDDAPPRARQLTLALR